MKIAVFHNLMSGGNKKFLYHTVKGFKQYGHRVTVYNLSISNERFSSLKDFADEIVTQPLFPVEPTGLLKLVAPPLQILQLAPLLQANRRIATAINQGDYDIVWVVNCFLTQHPLVLRYLEKPYILYTAEHFRAYYDRVLWRRPQQLCGKGKLGLTLRQLYLRSAVAARAQVDKLAMAQVTNVYCNSYFTAENIMRYYAVPAQPIYPGVDIAEYRELDIPRENLVLSVGAFSPLKGHDFVLEALTTIRPEKRPKLVIIADRVDSLAERHRCESFAKDHSVDLEIMTNITEENLVAVFNRAKLTLCANILEPFGMVPHESMACGTPVVAVREGGFRETVIDGQTGMLVPRDPKSMGEAVSHLLEDEELRRTLCRNGVAHVRRHHTHAHYFAQVEEALHELVGTRSR
ncbi:MAG: glycosyltransferase family 4 protein [Candidatus Competibacteraceae bacterium]